MKVSKLSKSLIAASLFTALGSVQAMEISHKDADLNSDGMVTEAEILNVIKTHFMKMDKDSDANVSLYEWDADNER